MNRPKRLIISLLLAFSFLTSLANALASGWTRSHDDLQWNRHVASCAYFDYYSMPIQTTGSRGDYWSKIFSRSQCVDLLAEKNGVLEDLYPFSVRVPGGDNKYLESSSVFEPSYSQFEVILKTVDGANFSKTSPVGFSALGSLVSSDQDVGEIKVSFAYGARIFYTSGPGGSGQHFKVESGERVFEGLLPVCIEWCLLDFSSRLLEDEVVVEFSDRSQNWGEWFALGVPSENTE
jgi:hypothetical protein